MCRWLPPIPATLCLRSQMDTVVVSRRRAVSVRVASTPVRTRGQPRVTVARPEERTSVAVQRGRGRGGVPNGPNSPADAVTEPMARVTASNGRPPGAPDVRERARAIPEAAVARLAVYLRVLSAMAEQGVSTISSEELSVAAGVNSAKLRKDLSYVGSHGIRGVGYEVGPLLRHLESALGLTHRQSVALVGIGNLGHALAGYGGFGGRGFPVTALFDVDPDLVGIKINGIVVE